MKFVWRGTTDYVAHVVFEAPVESLELFTGFYALVWGLWIWNPWINVFASAPGFRTMAHAPEWLWGSVLTAGALIQFAGRLHGRPKWQRVGAIIILAVWLFAAGALCYANWRFPSTVAYPTLALASWLVAYRARSTPKRIVEAVHGYGV